jgi:hypothetical protein
MRLAYAALAVVLAGCATNPTPVSSPVWMRTDGRPVASDAGLTQQFQIHRTICLGTREKADAAFLGCMAQKGDMLVGATDKIPISLEQFATLTAEQRSGGIPLPRQ